MTFFLVVPVRMIVLFMYDFLFIGTYYNYHFIGDETYTRSVCCFFLKLLRQTYKNKIAKNTTSETE